MKALRVVLFAIILSLLLWGTGYLIRGIAKKCVTGEEGKVNLLMTHTIDEPVMIFGSSVAWVHFDPRIIADSTSLEGYNFGINGTSLPQFQGLVYEFLEYTKECKYIVFAISSGEFVKRELLYEPHKFYSHIWNKNIYTGMRTQEDSWRLRYVPGYELTRYEKDFYQMVHCGYTSGGIINPDTARGFFPNNSTWDPKLDAANKNINNILKDRVNTENIELYKKVIDAIWKKNIKVILAITPYYVEEGKEIHAFREIRNACAKLQNEGVSVLDYTTSDICNRKELFYNNPHLNATGAAVFSSLFASDIKKIIKEHEGIKTQTEEN